MQNLIFSIWSSMLNCRCKGFRSLHGSSLGSDGMKNTKNFKLLSKLNSCPPWLCENIENMWPFLVRDWSSVICHTSLSYLTVGHYGYLFHLLFLLPLPSIAFKANKTDSYAQLTQVESTQAYYSPPLKKKDSSFSSQWKPRVVYTIILPLS